MWRDSKVALFATGLLIALVGGSAHGLIVERCRADYARAGGGKSVAKYTMTGRESSLRELEPVFKSLRDGEPFELHIPKGTKFNLFPAEPSYRVRHSAGTVDYFPYELRRATSENDKYTDDKLRYLQTALYDLERAQKRREPLEKVWGGNFDGRLFFTASPTTAKSNSLFKHPERLEGIIERTQELGRPPFLYRKKNGDMVLTDEHLLSHLKKQGERKLTLYRGHHSFDYFFYRLLLGKEDQKLRNQFAQWLEKNAYNVAYMRHIEPRSVEGFIAMLRDKKVPTDDVLGALSSQATTSAMFTSMTRDHSGTWAENKDLSEVVTLELDLEKIPDSYLPQILYGNDLDIEIVFPFATAEQRQALRSAMTLKPSRKR
jgi:hypothetical protein